MLRNKDKGITLIALVITIIILLILAGISISALTNQGLFKNAKAAQNATEKAKEEQGQRLNEYEDEINKYLENEDENTKAFKEKVGKVLSTTDNTEIKDAKNNKIVVPAGFKIVEGATTVDKGIVIEDVTETATKGSQFVWIPVGTIIKSDGTTATITLGRYDFDATTGKESTYSGSYIEEDANDTSTLKKYGNIIAKNIRNFKNSVATNGGYYIGRYEARTVTARNAAGNALTQITEKGTENVYNYVTQLQAAQLSQNMYNSDKFTSDLMNSYAWDTATVFIQNCGTNSKYSRQNSLNTSLSQTGTNSLTDTSKTDVQCNIYDMASNIWEWTTETSFISSFPCVIRGGSYGISHYYTSDRDGNGTSSSDGRRGFRPLLYL
ncbi:MAG: hypothetical protein ACLR44_03595 [Clostridia bacterium]